MKLVPKIGRYVLLEPDYEASYWVKVGKIVSISKDYVMVTAIEYTCSSNNKDIPRAFRRNHIFSITNPPPFFYTVHKSLESILAKAL